jgi:hypothetical protein
MIPAALSISWRQTFPFRAVGFNHFSVVVHTSPVTTGFLVLLRKSGYAFGLCLVQRGLIFLCISAAFFISSL